MQRRTFFRASAAGAGALCGWRGALAQKRSDPVPAINPADVYSNLDIVIGSGTGGGVDRIGRTLGELLVATRLVTAVRYENISGQAGTVALGQFVEKHHTNPNTILVSGMAMLGGIAMHESSVSLARVAPLARLTSEYLVLVVPASSPIATGQELVALLRDASRKTTFIGGSTGGADHLLFGMIRLALRAPEDQLGYLSAKNGREAMEALGSGRAQVGISDFSEMQPAIQAGLLRPLAISSRQSVHGLPSLKEVGVDAELSNWRGLFAPGGISAAQLARLGRVIEALVRSPEWARALKANDWRGTYKPSTSFRDDLEIEQAVVRVVLQLLKLKKRS